MNNLTRQKGFSIVEIVLAVVILGIIGFLGYTFYSNSQTKSTASNTSQSATANDVATAPNISSTADLDKAQALLDQTNPGSTTDASQLDSQLSNF